INRHNINVCSGSIRRMVTQGIQYAGMADIATDTPSVISDVFLGHYSIQTTVNKIMPSKSKISSLCVMLFASAFQLSILFSIIRIISGQ
ncbi:hypothetical protein, partial [Escherichia coli]|uniref:hypothetical protein n=1 Tax=Escherichia coli TaxID=562 RepID=UPI001BC83DE1